MDTSDPHPPWMRNLEWTMVILSALCILAVLIIVVMHLWWRSGCTTFGIC